MSVTKSAVTAFADYIIGDWNELNPTVQAAYGNFTGYARQKAEEALGTNHPLVGRLTQYTINHYTDELKAQVYEGAFETFDSIYEFLEEAIT